MQVKKDGFFPADLLFLSSTNPDGVCYIEVFSLFLLLFPEFLTFYHYKFKKLPDAKNGSG